MQLPSGLVSAALVRRLNRFAVEVETAGARVEAHLANSGRLQELMVPGVPVLLVPRHAPGRKTAYDLALVCVDGVWVSADARLPNALLREALAEGRLAAFAGCRVARSEVLYRGVRIDLLLECPCGPVLVEAKLVTLVEGGVGLFPDAPTERGRRHVEALAQAVAEGLRAAVVFVVQRVDAWAFSPHRRADPRFARALTTAAEAGVQVLAYRCRVDPGQISIDQPIAVRL
ncbi:MAG TPA: DNA/RNA nuclease SfsA [Dehalococcoidia bacterium]|nr:DNA/RNA nuclease SfsA [Dehalococcoidia bacterium]